MLKTMVEHHHGRSRCGCRGGERFGGKSMEEMVVSRHRQGVKSSAKAKAS